MRIPQVKYAGYPAPPLFDQPPGGGAKPKPIQQLLWGDWLQPTGQSASGWIEVRARGQTGWLRESDVQEERLLEVAIIDVGQGDGALLTTPGDRQILVDAGEGDNMYRYLRWRFNAFRDSLTFEHAVITHPDLDHYGGFQFLLERETLSIGTLHHNGILERGGTGTAALGPTKKVAGRRYLTDVITDEARLRAALPPTPTRRRYTELLRLALSSGRVGSVTMLSTADAFLPGYEAGKDLSIRVLSPVVETAQDGSPMLPWFGAVGPTKNGHSVVLQVRYRNVKVLLGGDLNRVAEERLLNVYAGRSPRAPVASLDAREVGLVHGELGSDIAKACHHGSGDFSDAFMVAVAPVATAVSSGDEEGYAHPRADALGAIGRTSRGIRPLIFSTELGRSSSEFRERPAAMRAEFDEARRALEVAVDPGARARAHVRASEARARLERSIAVYGAIQVRTDGRRAVVAQKIEQPVSPGRKWDAYALEPVSGTLTYVRHEG